MKNQTLLSLVIAASLIGAPGCALFGGGEKEEKARAGDFSASGPSIFNPRTVPSMVELNRNFQPQKPVEILAEVKDFDSTITEVKLRFVEAPIEVSMEHIVGSTWRAQIAPDQLKTLAVGGQTTRYRVNIVARNADGQVAVSRTPISLAVKAPDLGKPVG